jgi:hypothetical protein
MKVINVIHFNVEHDRGGRIEIEKGIHIFARLEDEVISSSELKGAFYVREHRAAHNRRIGICRGENGAAHCRTGAFSVCSAYSYSHRAFGHNVAEKIRSGDVRYSELGGAEVFGVILGDGDRIYEGVTAVDVMPRVAFVDKRAYAGEGIGKVRAASVRADNGVAASEGKVGQGGHIHSAYSAEKYFFAFYWIEQGAKPLGAEMGIWRGHVLCFSILSIYNEKLLLLNIKLNKKGINNANFFKKTAYLHIKNTQCIQNYQIGVL